jgi:hypothetical protein
MQVLRAKKDYGSTLTAKEEDVARANTDAVFEFACRFIVMRSLPGWIEEIYAEHQQSIHSVSAHTEKPGDPAFLAGVPCRSGVRPTFNVGPVSKLKLTVPGSPGVCNAHASVWKTTQASRHDRHQTPDQKIDV